MSHLQDRREDWESATDEEVLDALLSSPALINPFWMAFIRRTRPHCLRRALLLHEDMGGFLGRPARRFLGRKP